MKMWFLTFEIAPYFGGGLATYMTHIMRMYDGTPHEIMIFARDPSLPQRVSLEQYSDNISIFKFRGGIESYYAEFGYWSAVSNEFAQHVAFQINREGAPDLIESADGYGIAYICLQKKLTLDPLFKDITFVIVAHTPTYFIDRIDQKSEFKLPTYWSRQTERFCLGAADGLLWPSRMLKTELEREIRLDHPTQRIIRNPFQSLAVHTDTGDTKKRDHFFVASRLCYWKGITQALDSALCLWEQGSSIPLKLYGEDTYYTNRGVMMSDFIKSKYKKYYDDGLIQLCGNTPRSAIDVSSLRSICQLHPSLFDNFPYSVLEGVDAGNVMAFGATVGVSEILDDGDYVHFDTGNRRLAAKALSACAQLWSWTGQRWWKALSDKIRAQLNYKIIIDERQEFFEELCRRTMLERVFRS